jgi:hypothetical protein
MRVDRREAIVRGRDRLRHHRGGGAGQGQDGLAGAGHDIVGGAREIEQPEHREIAPDAARALVDPLARGAAGAHVGHGDDGRVEVEIVAFHLASEPRGVADLRTPHEAGDPRHHLLVT